MSTFSAILDGLHPVFVVGHPRSGTTLVQQLLTAHPAFWSAPETHLYTNVLEPNNNWQNRALSMNEIPDILTRLSQKPAITLPDRTAEVLSAEARRGLLGSAQLLNLIMQAYKPHDSTASRWLEKTPRHVYQLDTILYFFPDAKIIHVLRDPRGVASSPVRFSELQPGIERNVMTVERGDSWNRVVDLTDAMAGESRLLTIRYEDIISDRETALRLMMSHVDVEFDPTVSERFSRTYSQVTVVSESVRKQLNMTGEIVDRRAVYKQRMTDEEITLIDTICGDRMRKKGYIPDFEPQPQLVTSLRSKIPSTRPSTESRTNRKRMPHRILSILKRILVRLGS